MHSWKLLLVAFFLVLGPGHSQSQVQDLFMLQYLERRMSTLEERLAQCDQNVQTYEQKIYELSKELRSHLSSLSVYKAEVKSHLDGVVLRLDRAERDIEYLESQNPSEPCVEMENSLLEQQVKEAQKESKAKLNMRTDCSAVLTSVKSVKILKKAGDSQGSWLKDPSKGSAKVYFFSGLRNSTVLEFPSLQAFTGGNFSEVSRKVQLPVPWQGTGHVIYNGFLYYHKAGTSSEVVKVNARNRTLSESMLLQGAGRLPAYSLNPHTFIHLTTDELGLWAVHADPDVGGNLVVTKLDKSSLGVEQVWDTTCSSRDAETAFLICGTLHVVYNSHSGGRSAVRCLYDVHDEVHTEAPPLLFFPKRYSSHSSMQYHPKEKQLYAWDDGYQTIYKLDTKKNN